MVHHTAIGIDIVGKIRGLRGTIVVIRCHLHQRWVSLPERASPRKRCGHIGGSAEIGDDGREPEIRQNSIFTIIDEYVRLPDKIRPRFVGGGGHTQWSGLRARHLLSVM